MSSAARCDELAALLQARGASVVRDGDGALHISGASTDDVGALARANGVTLQELSSQQVSLEQRYLELTAASVDYRPVSDVGAASEPVSRS